MNPCVEEESQGFQNELHPNGATVLALVLLASLLSADYLMYINVPY